MGYLRRPLYFKKFRCIASACTDNCCVGWEIDIDDDTLCYYRKVKGAFGKRLMENITLPDTSIDEQAHFTHTANRRCPFLNESNLCDIILTVGEDHISQICTDHPRYYDWFLNGQEAGIGLCCEAAAKLILENTGYPEFEVIDDGEPGEEISGSHYENLSLELTLEHTLFKMREELFHIIKDDCSVSLIQKMTQLYFSAEKMQAAYDDILFPPAIDGNCSDLPVSNTSKTDNFLNTTDKYNNEFNWGFIFWNEKFLRGFLDFYLDLEINDIQWSDLLHEIKKNLPDILSHQEDFTLFYCDHLYEYEQLLIYFIYRYLLKAREDDAVMEKIHFALLSCSMIQLIDIYTWMKTGSLQLKQQLDICKLYSKEIEYDEDNMEKVSMYLRREIDSKLIFPK